MRNIRSVAPALAAFLFLPALLASPLLADTCRVKAVLGGKAVTMTHCAVSVYEDGPSVALWFSDAPFTAAEVDAFHLNSYPADKTEAGKPRTMLHFAFCPGGGKPEAGAASVKSVETSVNHADSVLLGRQWVFDLPKDAAILKIEKLSGSAVPGGKLSGRITGGKTSDGLAYSWTADFDVALPGKSAAAGQGCGK